MSLKCFKLCFDVRSLCNKMKCFPRRIYCSTKKTMSIPLKKLAKQMFSSRRASELFLINTSWFSISALSWLQVVNRDLYFMLLFLNSIVHQLAMKFPCSQLFILLTICYQCQACVVSNGEECEETMHPSMDGDEDLEYKIEELTEEEEFRFNGPESTSEFWRAEAHKMLREQLRKKPNKNKAKNVIMFLGDGMSTSTVTAARICFGQKMGHTGEESSLSFEQFPNVGFSKVIKCNEVFNYFFFFIAHLFNYHQTYCFDKQTADSACSATAYLTGVKANYATLGVNPKVRRNDCQASLDEQNRVSSIMSWAQKAGKSTGIVTTTRITHASPAGTYSHSASRDWECDDDMLKFPDAADCVDIAKQLIREEPGRNFNVIFGGGRKKFLPKNREGQRADNLNLIDEWLMSKNSPKAHYIQDRKSLLTLQPSNTEYVLGLFESDHLQYHLNASTNQPTLKEMTVAAIEIMKKNPNGFVLFVEGGRIDHGHHQNQARHALEETVEFALAIDAATQITDEKNTLMVVTADHAHTMTLSGYSKRGHDILGLNTMSSDVDKMPYTTLSYANGPSGGKDRHDMRADEMSEFKTLSNNSSDK